MNRPYFVLKGTNLLCIQGNAQPVWSELLYHVAGEGPVATGDKNIWGGAHWRAEGVKQ